VPKLLLDELRVAKRYGYGVLATLRPVMLNVFLGTQIEEIKEDMATD
jgi:hypothetical protein